MELIILIENLYVIWHINLVNYYNLDLIFNISINDIYYMNINNYSNIQLNVSIYKNI